MRKRGSGRGTKVKVRADENSPSSSRRSVWRLSMPTGQTRESGTYVSVRETFIGTTTEADERLDEMRAIVRKAPKIAAEKASGTAMASVLAKWLEHKKTRLSPNTTRTYEGYIAHRIVPALGTIEVSKLTVKHVNDFYSSMMRSVDQPIEPASIRQIHAILGNCMKQANAWGLVDRNVVSLAEPPSVERSEIHPPSDEQIRTLIATAERLGPLEAVIVDLAASTGARRAEITGIKWTDFTTQNVLIDGAVVPVTTVAIRRSILAEKKKVYEAPTKTRKSRTVTLDDDAVRRVETWRAAQNPKSKWVFNQDTGQPMSPNMLSWRWEVIRREAAKFDKTLKHVRYHDIRHWQASTLVDSGQNLAAVAARLGHENPNTTLKVYAHRSKAADLESANTIARAKRG